MALATEETKPAIDLPHTWTGPVQTTTYVLIAGRHDGTVAAHVSLLESVRVTVALGLLLYIVKLPVI